jgi:UDP-glucose 4-epimerase
MTLRVLITGGAGFIGSHLTDHLLAEGHGVTILDDFSSGRPENLKDAEANRQLRVIKGSVLDSLAVEQAMHGCDRVYHLAVQCVRRSLGKPIENHDINATGTLKVLDAARRNGIKRFIYCSSSEVYGNSGAEWLREDAPCIPVTVYGAAKLAGELYTSAYWQTYGLSTVVVRPFNAYGPRAHETGDLAEVIPRFVIRVLNDLPPVIFGSGNNGRDFTYVTDIARGIAIAADCDALVGRTVNIACGRMVTISEVAAMIARECARPDLRPLGIEPRPGDVFKLQADTKLARQVLGFRPELDFGEGIRRYIAWFRATHNDVAALLEERIQNWQMPAA